MDWLPGPSIQERSAALTALRRRSAAVPQSLLSELLSEEQILTFFGDESRIHVVEALAGTLPGKDHDAVLRAIWDRETQGSLQIAPDVAILRGRIAGVHHIRAAIGLCPDSILDPFNPRGKTRVFVLFVGPLTQSRLHTGLLVRISALFHNRSFVEKLLKAKTAPRALNILRDAEFPDQRESWIGRSLTRVAGFFENRYGLGR